MDKVCQADTGADQQSQLGAADSTTEQDGGQPQAIQTGRGEQQPCQKTGLCFGTLQYVITPKLAAPHYPVVSPYVLQC